MRIGVLFLSVSLASAMPAWAQSRAPRVEVFAGYSVLPGDRIDDFPRTTTSHGVQFDASVNVNRWFGVLADLGIQSSTNRDLGPSFAGLVARTRVTEFLVGPRFVGRSERLNFFGHGLVGWARGDAGDDFSGFSDTKPTFGGGVGVDVHLRDRVGVRGQFDLLASFADIVEGNTRFAVGVVLALGGS